MRRDWKKNLGIVMLSAIMVGQKRQTDGILKKTGII